MGGIYVWVRVRWEGRGGEPYSPQPGRRVGVNVITNKGLKGIGDCVWRGHRSVD